MTYKWLRWLITAGAIAVAGARFVWPAAPIDGITAILLLAAIVPWLQPLFKALELPGGLKVEFQDLQRVEGRAAAAGLLPAPLAREKTPEYTFLQVAASDPNLALAGLRIELERRLRRLAHSAGEPNVAGGLAQLLIYLNQKQLINAAERSALRDLASLLSSAVHGAEVDALAADWALDVGPRILEALDDRLNTEAFSYEGILPDEK